MSTLRRDPLPPRATPAGPSPNRLRTVAALAAWAAVGVVALSLINAADFGPPGEPATVALRFAVETAVFTVLAYAALRSPPLRRRPGPRGSAVLGLWVALVVLSDCLSRLGYGVFETALAELRAAMGVRGLVVGIFAYMLALALPFVPGVEIGLMVMLVFGAGGAIAVYAATVAALCLAFAAGRLVPARLIVRLLARAGIAVPDEPLDDAIARVVAVESGNRSGWQRLAARLLRYRYLALAAALNLPGNSVFGGGGGIALLCGASRQFEWRGFALAVVVATAPVPLLVIVGGLDMRDLVHLMHFMQNTFARLFG